MPDKMESANVAFITHGLEKQKLTENEVESLDVLQRVWTLLIRTTLLLPN